MNPLWLCSVCLSSLLTPIHAAIDSNGHTKPISQTPRKDVLRRTHAGHPEFKGFSYCYGYLEKYVVASSEAGYIDYDMDLYDTQFTPCSRLYLVHAQAQYTPGFMGNLSGQKGFDSSYRSANGYLSIRIPPKSSSDTVRRDSSTQLVAAWPAKTAQTATFTSSYGGNSELNALLNGGISEEGIELKASLGASIAYTYTYSYAISNPNPQLSRTIARDDSRKYIWTFYYGPLGTDTYVLDAFLLFEVKNDGIIHDAYSFYFDIEFDYSLRGNGRIANLHKVKYEHYGINP